ncbi:UDP-N-acetylmuramate dehydrogenase [bacterium CPR1]|nr:UDP-N-acetylmuramate dehydrogenase [bacterium CPR1]
MSWRENVPLAVRTTLGVGGPARWHALAHTPAELAEHLRRATSEGLPTLMLGGGSNLLIADAGFPGLVVEYLADRIETLTSNGTVRLRVDAGVVWDNLVEYTVREHLAGLECLSGIPGRVGAAPIQNIGAYGQEVAERLQAVLAIERASGAEVRLPAEECGFGYRWSHFKGPWLDRYVVTGVELVLTPGGAASVRYAELQRRLAADAPLAEVRRTVLAIRRSKSMVYDPSDPNHRSAGSFFMNPVVEAAQVREGMPSWPAGEGRAKLSAAWLIEQSGFPRGFLHGRVGLSSNHSLALINRGQATAAELVELAGLIRREVRERFGVTLVPEPVLIGFDRSVHELLGA